jgi:hypothetical protein
VTTGTIAANAVTSAKIASNAVLARHIAANAVSGSEIASNSQITASTFTGALTGNVTGNVTGNLTGTVQTAAQTNITSVGTLSSLTVSGDLTVDTNTLYVDSADNRVGIGTTNPDYRLSLVDTTQLGTTIQLFRTGQAAGSIFINNGISFGSDGGNGDTQRMTINFSTGNVGIGTTNPNGKLTISNNGIGGFEFTPDTTSFSVANTNYIASYDRTALAYRDMVFDLGGAENQSIRFKAGGNVGIGKSSPSSKLEIYGGNQDHLRLTQSLTDINYIIGPNGSGNLAISSTGTGAGGDLFIIQKGGNVGINTTSPGAKLHTSVSAGNGSYGRALADSNLILENTNTLNTQSGYLHLVGYTGNSTAQYQMGAIGGGKQTTAADGDYGGYLSFWTTSGGAGGEANSGMYERLRISSSGNVGIGTTASASILDVIDSGVARLTIGYSGTSANYYDADNHYFRSANAASYPLRISTTQVLAGTSAYGTGVLAYDRDLGAPNWGMNITENSTFNDNSGHNFTSKQNTHGVIYIKDEGNNNGFAAIPFYPNAGGGIAYQWSVLDPDSATWSSGAPSITVNLGGTSGLGFGVTFAAGSGVITITRTSGSQLYRVVFMEFAQS